jgi:hypothetical protein
MISGLIKETIKIAKGPPIIIPIVPVKNIISALEPNFFISLRSILIVKRARLVGRRYLDDTKYRFELSPEIIPNELKIEGIK